MYSGRKIIQFTMDHPGPVLLLVVIITLLAGIFLVRVHVDMNPEIMLPAKDPVRLLYEQARKEFNLHDVIILGVVNNVDKDGVFNPGTLKKINTLSRFAATLHDPKHPERRVLGQEIIAPDNVDIIEPAGLGKVRFRRLMNRAPATRGQALAIRDLALNNPFLRGTLVSADGRAMALYIPVSRKDFAHRVSLALKARIRQIGAGSDRFYITGMLVAEDTYGKEMLFQITIFASLALLVILLLMLLLFRKIWLSLLPPIVVLVTVTVTMGLLIGTGNSLQIISSLLPIFLLPVAVLYSVHIISEFIDRHRQTGDRDEAVSRTTEHLFFPMLFTSLTSAAGFSCLSLTSLPQLRTFGIYMAIGIMVSWLLSILLIPACIMLLKKTQLKDMGGQKHSDPADNTSLLNRHLHWIGARTLSGPWLIIGCNLLVMAIGMIGIFMGQINDNPVKWFRKSHPIRIADSRLNHHFGGISEAYLILSGMQQKMTPQQAADWLSGELNDKLIDTPVIRQKVLAEIDEAVAESDTSTEMADLLEKSWTKELTALPLDADIAYDRWSLALDSLGRLRNQQQIFKRPEVLNYIAGLQQYLVKGGIVVKSNSVVDLVRTVHQQLMEGNPHYLSIPGTVNGVAQVLLACRTLHKPDLLTDLVSRDYRRASIRLQMQHGDSRDMEQVVRDVAAYFQSTPPPVQLQYNWTGPTYLNTVWQDRLITSIRRSLPASFCVIFLLTTLLFRSPLWGVLNVIPLLFTIIILYGIPGLTGGDRNVPTALLAFLALGLAADLAIHLLLRTREGMQGSGNWKETLRKVFEQPARAIAHGIIVLTIGFTPLLLAPLVPCQRVGISLALIMLCAGQATLWLLPSLLTLMQRWLFRQTEPKKPA